MRARWVRSALVGTSLAVMVGLVSIRSASAVVLFDSTGGGGTTSTATALSGSVPLGDSFITGTGWTLTSVSLDVFLSAASTANFAVYLEGNAVTSSLPAPNAASAVFLGTVSDSNLSTTAITAPTLSVDQPLAANTRYWIVLASGSRSGASAAEWVYQSTLTSSGLVNANYEYNSTLGNTASNASLTPYEMLLLGTIAAPSANVPEPASLLLMMVPLLGLYLGRRYRPAA